nr:MAG TPA: hypothetical protein [Caudoviricetes sp.]DAS50696.1 MAG TPA: hypothetical protein [Caudoviricetes sp.]DAY27144.1 MAG TPA: hypothetical protein [Caudoviricetes sp.]
MYGRARVRKICARLYNKRKGVSRGKCWKETSRKN